MAGAVSAVAAIILCCILAFRSASVDLTLYLQALVQGIVEGVTEFLPVSSTGHMIIVDSFFPMKDAEFAKLFEVVIQLGAILSVLVYFYKTIFPKKWNVDGFMDMIPLWSRVVVGVIPAAVIGFLLDDFIEAHLFNVVVVSVALVVWGVALVFSGYLEKCKSNTPEIVKMSYHMALAVGFFQCLAMVPGTSRSAVTILGAMCLGCSRACAAEFSFFLAIPTMFGASLLKLLKGGAHLTPPQWIALGIGFVTAFFVAWAVIAWFMDYVKRHDFKLFGWYRIVLGIILLILLFCGVIRLSTEKDASVPETQIEAQAETSLGAQSGADALVESQVETPQIEASGMETPPSNP
ncbi:MAG: undecaprenyl-diphosphate phosphatase [Lentisphaeria bacterium]|nr:undecaprenyl-diphosphate phosphatase [Lentisphaeria bacterium]